MKNKNVYRLLMIIFSVCILLTSCGEKGLNKIKTIRDNKKLQKATKIYETEGFNEYLEYVTENTYYSIKDENGTTPLLVAAKNGNINALLTFLEKGASPIEKDNNGLNVVDYILMNEDLDDYEILDDIIYNKFPTSIWNDKNSQGDLAVTQLINRGAPFELIEKTVNSLPNINVANSNGKTLLMFAAQNNIDEKIVNLLLKKSADVNLINNNEWSAAMYAARYNPNPKVLEKLLQKGASTKPNSAGLNLIMLAACNQNPAVLYNLLNYVSDINATTEQGKTALMYACENKVGPITLKILIKKGANLNLKDNYGKSALMYAIENYNRSDEIKILLDNSANPYDVDVNNKTIDDYLIANKDLNNSDIAVSIREMLANQPIITSENEDDAKITLTDYEVNAPDFNGEQATIMNNTKSEVSNDNYN